VSKRESESRPQFGIVTWRTEGLNQKGEIVVSYRRSNLVAKRSAS
jgi:acyl dehydratase